MSLLKSMHIYMYFWLRTLQQAYYSLEIFAWAHFLTENAKRHILIFKAFRVQFNHEKKKWKRGRNF